MQIRNIGMCMLVHLVHTVHMYSTIHCVCTYVVHCSVLISFYQWYFFLQKSNVGSTVARKGMLCRFFFFFILSVAFVTQSISFFLSLFSYILQPKSPPPTLLENISDDAQLYVTKFVLLQSISLYWTERYVTQSFAISSIVTYSKICQKLSNSASPLVPLLFMTVLDFVLNGEGEGGGGGRKGRGWGQLTLCLQRSTKLILLPVKQQILSAMKYFLPDPCCALVENIA